MRRHCCVGGVGRMLNHGPRDPGTPDPGHLLMAGGSCFVFLTSENWRIFDLQCWVWCRHFLKRMVNHFYWIFFTGPRTSEIILCHFDFSDVFIESVPWLCTCALVNMCCPALPDLLFWGRKMHMQIAKSCFSGMEVGRGASSNPSVPLDQGLGTLWVPNRQIK